MQTCKFCNNIFDADKLFCSFDGEILKKDIILKNKYAIKEKIGGGGMGFVYEAEHLILGHRIAIKVLKPNLSVNNHQEENRFLREAKIMARLEHENIIKVIDYDSDFSYAFFVMEYLTGKTLEQKIQESKMLPLEETSNILSKVSSAITYAHQEDVLHRDLKPSNIFLAKDSKGKIIIKVLDFGIAKILDPEETKITKTNSVIGTPHYMSPEQINNDKNIDQRADIYSLGIILYEMLCGKVPFDAPTPMQIGIMHCTKTPISIQENGRKVSSKIEDIVQKALAKEKKERQKEAIELSNEFNLAIQKEGTILNENFTDEQVPIRKELQAKPNLDIKIDNRKKNVFKKKVKISGDFNN